MSDKLVPVQHRTSKKVLQQAKITLKKLGYSYSAAHRLFDELLIDEFTAKQVLKIKPKKIFVFDKPTKLTSKEVLVGHKQFLESLNYKNTLPSITTVEMDEIAYGD